MKEASGELNMTAITIVAISLVAAFFVAFVLPALKRNVENGQNCAAAVCGPCSNKRMDCSYTDKNNSVQPITCPCKEQDQQQNP